MITEEQVLAKAKQIAPWFWPADPWSVDLSCAQGQQRTLQQARRELVRHNELLPTRIPKERIMKTETLTLFQYQNAATTYYVSATEYRLTDGSVQFRVSVVNNGESYVVKPAARSEAMQIAESAIADFVRDMAQVYLPGAGVNMPTRSKPVFPVLVVSGTTPKGHNVVLAAYRPEDVSDVDPLIEGHDQPVWLWFEETQAMASLFWMGDRTFCFTTAEALIEADNYL